MLVGDGGVDEFGNGMGWQMGMGLGDGKRLGYAQPSHRVLRLMSGRACPHQSFADHPKL